MADAIAAAKMACLLLTYIVRRCHAAFKNMRARFSGIRIRHCAIASGVPLQRWYRRVRPPQAPGTIHQSDRSLVIPDCCSINQNRTASLQLDGGMLPVFLNVVKT